MLAYSILPRARVCMCVCCARARVERARETALLALKIGATDICPGNVKACVEHVASHTKKPRT